MSFHVITILPVIFIFYGAHGAPAELPSLIDIKTTSYSSECIGTPVERIAGERTVWKIVTAEGCGKRYEMERTAQLIFGNKQNVDPVEIEPTETDLLDVIYALEPAEISIANLPQPEESPLTLKSGITVVFQTDALSPALVEIMDEKECKGLGVNTGVKNENYFCGIIGWEGIIFRGAPLYTEHDGHFTLWGVDTGIPNIRRHMMGGPNVRIYVDVARDVEAISKAKLQSKLPKPISPPATLVPGTKPVKTKTRTNKLTSRISLLRKAYQGKGSKIDSAP